MVVAPQGRTTTPPMEVVERDSIGPLPADEDGNKYILTVICCFTQWVSLLLYVMFCVLQCDFWSPRVISRLAGVIRVVEFTRIFNGILLGLWPYYG